MTQAFTTYAFTATGAITPRNEPDRLFDVVNVKDYGAVGNGVTDDTDAIQDAFDAAFGSSGSQHGETDRFDNKVVVFPAGNYKILSTISITGVYAGWIRGSGSGTTTITYAGTVTGGWNGTVGTSWSTRTSLFYINGLHGGRISGISFVMTGGNAFADNTVCVNDTWDGGAGHSGISLVNNSQVTYTDCSFSGATFGLLIGDVTATSVGEGSGFQSDAHLILGCRFDDCYRGLQAVNLNAIQSGIYGGSITNCEQFGIFMPSGSIATISGVSFANNGDTGISTGDIEIDVGVPVFVVGCHSTSINFLILAAGGHYVGGCRHVASGGTAGRFVRLGASDGRAVIEACYSSHGYLQGHSASFGFYISDLVLDNPDWTHGAAFIREWYQAAPFTFATLPGTGDSAWWGTGLIFNITDCNTATWAATAAGGGATKAAIRWNGANWTVMGI